MGTWLSVHLDDIYALTCWDDIDYFRAEMRDLDRLQAKWPMEDKPQYLPVPCWVQVQSVSGELEECKAKIVKHPPRFAGDDPKIVCDYGHVFSIDDFDRMQSAFRQVRDEELKARVKAAKVATRLTKKHAG